MVYPHPDALALAVAALATLGSAGPAAAEADRPNVLFILTEDAGAFDSVVGTPGVQTPGLESIANRGFYFNNAHAAGPVCSVSKVAILTGLMPHSNNTRTNVVNHFPGVRGIPAVDITPDDQRLVDRMIEDERGVPLNARFAVPDGVPTLVEVLNDRGYYTGVTHKLHVPGVERFRYDHWVDGEDPSALNKVAAGAAAANEPFFLLYNTPDPHRPYTNGDNRPLSVDPADVVVPGQFVDTPVARQDWAEHLDGVEAADDKVVDVLGRLDDLGLTDNTVVVFMSDHGPSWHRGKQSTYDLGSRVSLAIAGPGVVAGGRNDTVVNGIDLMPTLLDLIGVSDPPGFQGESLATLLDGTRPTSDAPRYSVTEVQHQVRTTETGQNEKKITDGDFSLIYRFNHTGQRELNADQYVSGAPWRNRVYAETLRVYDDLQANPGRYTAAEAERIRRSYRLLDEMDSSSTRNHDLFVNQKIELFHNDADPYELNNLIGDPAAAGTRDRLLSALYAHTLITNDTHVDARLLPAPGVTGDHFEGRVAGSALGSDASWSTPITGNSGEDFRFDGAGRIQAPRGIRALATYDGSSLGAGESFLAAIDVDFTRPGAGAGLVFGYEDAENFYEFQLLDGDTVGNPSGQDVRLVRVEAGVETIALLVTELENIDLGEAYRLVAAYDAQRAVATLTVVDEHGVPYHSGRVALDGPLAAGSRWGLSTRFNSTAEFGRFDLQIIAAVPEPASLVLLAAGSGGLLLRRRQDHGSRTRRAGGILPTQSASPRGS